MGDVNYTFFLSLSIIVLGYILKSLKVVSEKEGKTLTGVILNLTLPALIINTVHKIAILPELVLLPFICIGYSLIISCFSFMVFRKIPNDTKGALSMCVIGYNIGLFAYPLIEGIWGPEGLKYIALFDVGNAFIIFGLSYIIGAIYSPKDKLEDRKIDFKYIALRLLKSAPLMSYVIALALNFSQVTFPSFISDLLDILGRANMALVLLVLGIYLNFNFEKSEWWNIIKVLLIRYCCGLGVGLLLYFLLPFDALYRGIVLIAFILPIGMAVIPFSVQFGYNEKITSTLANLSILISFGLMWLLILILQLA